MRGLWIIESQLIEALNILPSESDLSFMVHAWSSGFFPNRILMIINILMMQYEF